MFTADVTCAAMPPRKTADPKEQVSLTLSAKSLKALREIADAMEVKPSISRLVDRAVSEYLRNRSNKAGAGSRR